MRIVVTLGIVLTPAPALAGVVDAADVDLHVGYHRAARIDHYGTQLEVTWSIERVQIRAAVGYEDPAVSLQLAAGPFLEVRPYPRLRLLAALEVGFAFESWRSTDNSYYSDGALALVLGARAGGTIDLGHIDTTPVWIGAFADAYDHSSRLGNHLNRDLETAITAVVAVGLRI